VKILETIHSSVRPIVTFALAGAFVVGFFRGSVPPDVFSSLVISVVSYWFGSRERSVPDAGALPIVAATSDTTTVTHAEAPKE
jgi:hypothetical protein